MIQEDYYHDFVRNEPENEILRDENRILSTRSHSQLAGLITESHIRAHQNIDTQAQESNRALIKETCEASLNYLQQAIDLDSDVLFSEYMKWTTARLKSLEWSKASIRSLFISFRSILKRTYLSAGLRLMDQAIVQLDNQSGALEAMLKDEPSSMASIYLDYLLRGKRTAATDYIMNLLEEGITIKDIYIDVFQRSQYELGYLWERNEISIAQEHYCTAATQLIMSMLYPRILTTQSNGKRVVATCVGSELHEIGVRMVSDFLEMEGWDAYYLGANVPTHSILQAIEDREADLLAISVTLTPYTKRAREVIREVRSNHQDVKILIGGYPFNQDPDLWVKVGADGYSPSATEVPYYAETLVS